MDVTGARAGRYAILGWAGLVAIGGAVGATIRAASETAFPAPVGGWPWTTFVINLLGSFVLGFLLELLLRSGPDAGWRRGVRLGCGTGVLGGFTTYSSFAVEVVQLGQHDALGVGVVYALVSVAVGVLAAILGIVLGTALRRRGGRRR